MAQVREMIPPLSSDNPDDRINAPSDDRKDALPDDRDSPPPLERKHAVDIYAGPGVGPGAGPGVGLGNFSDDDSDDVPIPTRIRDGSDVSDQKSSLIMKNGQEAPADSNISAGVYSIVMHNIRITVENALNSDGKPTLMLSVCDARSADIRSRPPETHQYVLIRESMRVGDLVEFFPFGSYPKESVCQV